MTLAREQRETALRSRRFSGTFGSVDFRGESSDFGGVFSRVDLENEPIFCRQSREINRRIILANKTLAAQRLIQLLLSLLGKLLNAAAGKAAGPNGLVSY